ncbi:MAG TPA: sulfatase-like hydrolase/transferase [Candidatus Limnocylindrales bacterium]
MKRRIVLGLVMAVAFLVPAASAKEGVHPANHDERQPDIIVVMVDDLGAIDNRIINRLPNIKALFAEGGLRFDNYYSETPLCCPGRAEFLTGQHVHNNHVTENIAGLLDPSQTIATVLHDDGYQTAQIGKYMNAIWSISDKTPPGWDYNAMFAPNTLTATTSNWFIQNVKSAQGYMDRVTEDLSVEWVQNAASNQPLFLWTTPHAPHYGASPKRPWVPFKEAQYTGDGGSQCDYITPWKPPSYSYAVQPSGFPLGGICRSLLTVNDEVGRLELAEAARERPAVWVFTSDNGMAWGWHGFPVKNVPEASKNVLFMAGDGIEPGTTNALQSNIDLAPTLAEIAGTSMPFADGQSFLGVLNDPDSAGRDWMLEDHPLGGITSGPWTGGWWGIHTHDWYLLYRKDVAAYFLFDLNADPARDNDVSAQNPDVVNQLKALYPWGAP